MITRLDYVLHKNRYKTDHAIVTNWKIDCIVEVDK